MLAENVHSIPSWSINKFKTKKTSLTIGQRGCIIGGCTLEFLPDFLLAVRQTSKNPVDEPRCAVGAEHFGQFNGFINCDLYRRAFLYGKFPQGDPQDVAIDHCDLVHWPSRSVFCDEMVQSIGNWQNPHDDLLSKLHQGRFEFFIDQSFLKDYPR